VVISIYYDFCMMAVPFLSIFAAGFFYVGFSSLQALRQMGRERTVLPIPAVGQISA
jgi:hypothetical protein